MFNQRLLLTVLLRLVSRVNEVLSLRIKRSALYADHLSPPNVEVKIDWSNISIFQCDFMALTC
jgi:hypothetical protein